MKKILILLLILLVAGGCASSVSWEDAKPVMEEVYQTAIKDASGYDSYSADEFKALIASVCERAESLEEGIKEDKQEEIKEIYHDNIVLRLLASESNSIESNMINQLSLAVEDMIISAYEKNGELKENKDKMHELREQIDGWNDDNWALVEKRKKLSWNEVKDEYEKLEQDTIAELKAADEVVEAELEEYKNIITDNYSAIANGVDANNKKYADLIYESAVALNEYTKDLEGEQAEKVNKLAVSAKNFVQICYGANITDDLDFETQVQSAKKWTLSLWNEITTLLRQ